MNNNEILKRFKKALCEEGIMKSEIDNILGILEEILPTEKRNTNDDLIKYAEKIYQKKYGDEEIFVQYPLSAKIRIDLNKFRKIFNIDFKEYKRYIEWLLECNEEKMNIYDLCNNKLYKKFQENYEKDSSIIEEKKELNSKRILRLD